MSHTFLTALADPVFRMDVAPGAEIAHPAWRRARSAALEALSAGRNAVLVGSPGSGKSLLLANLAHTLRKAGKPVHVVGQDGGSLDLLADGVLLVDDAGTLGTDALAVLCGGAGPILLSMLPGGPDRLPRRPRPVRRVVLDRLAPLEVAQFVAARLAAAGRPRDFLEPEAVLALAEVSAGSPRLVNVFGAAAVFLAGLDNSPRVGLRHMEEAASMRAEPAVAGQRRVELFAALPSPGSEALRRRAALGGMVAASGLLFVLPWLGSKRPGGLPQVADAGTVQVADGQTVALDPSFAHPANTGAEASAPPAGDGAGTPVRSDQPMQPVAVEAVPPRPADPVPVAPRTERRALAATDAPLLFRGPIFNETMGQGGRVDLAIRRQAPAGVITARFDASQGLSGAGTLAGRVSGAGRITASGQLAMGRNSFMCDLSGTLAGNSLTGSASFVRDGNGKVYRSRFNLVRV